MSFGNFPSLFFFSDRDNDEDSQMNCAALNNSTLSYENNDYGSGSGSGGIIGGGGGGWWFTSCYHPTDLGNDYVCLNCNRGDGGATGIFRSNGTDFRVAWTEMYVRPMPGDDLSGESGSGSDAESPSTRDGVRNDKDDD